MRITTAETIIYVDDDHKYDDVQVDHFDNNSQITKLQEKFC